MLNKLIYTIGKPVDAWLNGKREGRMLDAGEIAPDFTVKTHEGKTVSLKDYRGKSVVLWFFPKADTPG